MAFHRWGFLILFAAPLVAVPLAAAKDDAPHVLYLHADGTMDPHPSSGGTGTTTLFRSAPASDAYLLRAGSVVHVFAHALLGGQLSAKLELDGVTLASASRTLAPLAGGDFAITFANAETLVGKWSVLAIELGAPASDGSLLLAHPSAPRFEFTAAAAPAPPTLAPAPASPPPVPASLPAAAPPDTPRPTSPAPPSEPTPSAAPAAASFDAIPSSWSSQSVLAMGLVGAAAFAGYAFVALGRS
jgi:hypothetical protein